MAFDRARPHRLRERGHGLRAVARASALGVLMAALAGCDAHRPTPTDPFDALRARPLSTALVDCERPALGSRLPWTTAVGVGTGSQYGTDEVVAVPGIGDRRGLVPARRLTAGEARALRVGRGALIQKVLWAFNPSVATPGAAILIRGAAVGHSGQIFPAVTGTTGRAPDATEIRVIVPATAVAGHSQPSTTVVTRPGCYVYQVDGVQFTAQIALRYAPEASPSR